MKQSITHSNPTTLIEQPTSTNNKQLHVSQPTTTNPKLWLKNWRKKKPILQTRHNHEPSQSHNYKNRICWSLASLISELIQERTITKLLQSFFLFGLKNKNANNIKSPYPRPILGSWIRLNASLIHLEHQRRKRSR